MKLFSLLITALISISAFAANDVTVPTERGQLDFGLVPYMGARSQVLELTNNGDAAMQIHSAKIRGDAFYLKNNCPKVLEVGQTCSAKITFRGVRAGMHAGRLTVLTSVKNYIVDLYGTADKDPTNNLPLPPNYP
jgi:hypothetical protein